MTKQTPFDTLINSINQHLIFYTYPHKLTKQQKLILTEIFKNKTITFNYNTTLRITTITVI